jgi:hypothetical protein
MKLILNQTSLHKVLHEYLSTWFSLLQVSDAASFKFAAEGKESTPVSGVRSCCQSPVEVQNWKWSRLKTSEEQEDRRVCRLLKTMRLSMWCSTQVLANLCILEPIKVVYPIILSRWSCIQTMETALHAGTLGRRLWQKNGVFPKS